MNERNRQQRRYYVDGNTARKLNTAPVREERPRKKRKVNKRIARNVRRSRAFSLGYTLALLFATSILFVACISMLTLDEKVTKQRNDISSLEERINALTDENNETAKQLQSSVNLIKVYDFAVNELGMEYPKNGQVLYYHATNPDYVKQFKDVPKE